ncbi:hypothetical protein ACOSQ4_004241 [Xanthoceras sorbifolium]
MLGMCLGGARRMRITLGAAWELLGPVCHELSLPSQLLHFSSYSSPLGRYFSSPLPPPRPVVTVAWSRPSLDRWELLDRELQVTVAWSRPSLDRWELLDRELHPEEHRSRSSSPCPLRPFLLRRELHRELLWSRLSLRCSLSGWLIIAARWRMRASSVAVELALLIGLGLVRLQRERGREERAGRHAYNWVFIFLFCFLTKTVLFQLKPSCLRCKMHRFTNGWVNFLKLHFCPSTLLFFHRCPSTMLLKLHIFPKNI